MDGGNRFNPCGWEVRWLQEGGGLDGVNGGEMAEWGRHFDEQKPGQDD